MRHRSLCCLVLPLLYGAGCAPWNQSNSPERAARGDSAGDISQLSDEFDSAKTLRSWKQVYKTEGGNANQLELLDINQTRKGKMVMVPYSSTWYKDYRGVLAYKTVTGDFQVTTKLRVSRRNGTGAPRTQFSLAGLMVRSPREITPETWRPGEENYVFLSLGAGDSPGNYQLEVKTTVNSDSQLQLTPMESGEAVIGIARIGANLIMMVQENGRWHVHKRYYRPDFPETLQVGLTCYTDWPTASSLSPQEHNAMVIRHGNPDLVAQIDYVRYRRPQIPAEVKEKRRDELQGISDNDLVRMLSHGEN